MATFVRRANDDGQPTQLHPQTNCSPMSSIFRTVGFRRARGLADLSQSQEYQDRSSGRAGPGHDSKIQRSLLTMRTK
jgi:hypothetical protein